MNDDILIMAVPTPAQKRLCKDLNKTSELLYIELNKQMLPTLKKFISTHGAERYCNRFSPAVRISGRRSTLIKTNSS